MFGLGRHTSSGSVLCAFQPSLGKVECTKSFTLYQLSVKILLEEEALAY